MILKTSMKLHSHILITLLVPMSLLIAHVSHGKFRWNTYADAMSGSKNSLDERARNARGCGIYVFPGGWLLFMLGMNLALMAQAAGDGLSFLRGMNDLPGPS